MDLMYQEEEKKLASPDHGGGGGGVSAGVSSSKKGIRNEQEISSVVPSPVLSARERKRRLELNFASSSSPTAHPPTAAVRNLPSPVALPLDDEDVDDEEDDDDNYEFEYVQENPSPPSGQTHKPMTTSSMVLIDSSSSHSSVSPFNTDDELDMLLNSSSNSALEDLAKIDEVEMETKKSKFNNTRFTNTLPPEIIKSTPGRRYGDVTNTSNHERQQQPQPQPQQERLTELPQQPTQVPNKSSTMDSFKNESSIPIVQLTNPLHPDSITGNDPVGRQRGSPSRTDPGDSQILRHVQSHKGPHNSMQTEEQKQPKTKPITWSSLISLETVSSDTEEDGHDMVGRRNVRNVAASVPSSPIIGRNNTSFKQKKSPPRPEDKRTKPLMPGDEEACDTKKAGELPVASTTTKPTNHPFDTTLPGREPNQHPNSQASANVIQGRSESNRLNDGCKPPTASTEDQEQGRRNSAFMLALQGRFPDGPESHGSNSLLLSDKMLDLKDSKS